MNVSVNEELTEFNGETITELLDQLGTNKLYIAVSVNEEIIPRSQHSDYKIKPEDKIIIVQAVGGG